MCKIEVRFRRNPEDFGKLWDSISTTKDWLDSHADYCRRTAIDYEVALLAFATEKHTRRVYVVRENILLSRPSDAIPCRTETRFTFYSYDDRRNAFRHARDWGGKVVIHNLDGLIAMSEEHFADLGRCADPKVSKAAREYRDAMSKWKITKLEKILQKRV